MSGSRACAALGLRPAADAAGRAAIAPLLADCLAELGSPPAYPWLDHYGREPGRHAYLIEDESGHVAGFALLRELDAAAMVVEVAEFYIAPAARRGGVGRRAVVALRQRHSQRWQVETFGDQPAAVAFWRAALPAQAPQDAPATVPGARPRMAFAWPAAALGVPAGSARLESHDPGWAALFQRERDRIAAALGTAALDIQHVGSTAVPHLAAKPVIDIAVAVRNPAALAGTIGPLVGLGYRDLGWRSAQIGHFLERTGAAGRTHCIHLLETGSPHWQDYLRLRDRLRTDATARARYQTLKQALAADHADDRKAYTRGKHALVQQLLETAAPSSP
ncbi:GNAT family N-acetyltransferase [Xylophilus sp.]|uniref:GNAT family N-acetyltransferase n=1 Tax=Xylophilus sp. TaxID=2653893 RepID=UPI0013BC3E10|nr:GNAT family N-acetyltransferase [Xylophilus sp.]KAF1049194.1 MAG: Dephospho-CoA kinase [Xylophilus sp.]